MEKADSDIYIYLFMVYKISAVVSISIRKWRAQKILPLPWLALRQCKKISVNIFKHVFPATNIHSPLLFVHSSQICLLLIESSDAGVETKMSGFAFRENCWRKYTKMSKILPKFICFCENGKRHVRFRSTLRMADCWVALDLKHFRPCFWLIIRSIAAVFPDWPLLIDDST